MQFPPKSPITWVAGLVALTVWLIRYPLSHVRFFDPDEFQHMHHAWYDSMGQVPYRDFIDHHTPLFHAFLAPFFSLHDVTSSFAEGEAMLFLARKIVWVLAGIVVILAFDLGRRWRGVEVGAVSAALLSTTIMFVDKTLEIRPDLFTMIFWLGALSLTLEGIRSDGSNHRRDLRLFVGSGACIGLGLLSSQKLLFAGPGFAATMIWFLAESRSARPAPQRVKLVVAQVVGLAIPLVLAFAFFASKGALGAFIHYNLSANVGLTDRFTPFSRIRNLLRQNPFHVALGLTGVVLVAARMARSERVRRGDYLVVLNLVGLVIGLFLNPVPYEQSFLTLMPLLAMLAASLLVNGGRELFVSSGIERKQVLMLAGAALLASAFCVRYAVPVIQRYGLLFPAAAVVALLACFVCYRVKLPDAAVASLVALLAVLPVAQLFTEFRASSKAQLAAIEAVYANSRATDTFLDGFTGFGVFRPHASRFWFLHREMQAMMTDADKREVIAGVTSGRITPKVIGYDRSLKALSPVLNQYIETHYHQLGTGPLYVR